MCYRCRLDDEYNKAVAEHDKKERERRELIDDVAKDVVKRLRGSKVGSRRKVANMLKDSE
jgi:hypothetical protein